VVCALLGIGARGPDGGSVFEQLPRLRLADGELLAVEVPGAVVELNRVGDHLELHLLRRHQGMIRTAAEVRSTANTAWPSSRTFACGRSALATATPRLAPSARAIARIGPARTDLRDAPASL
jgi:hypothetical protein